MTAFAVGCVSELDGFEHAAVHRHVGLDIALCGAGRITLRIDGEFDPADSYACPSCALLVVEHSGELGPSVERLRREFPDAPRDVVTSMLADSYRTVVGVTDKPLVSKAEDLTRLRLEARMQHPALR